MKEEWKDIPEFEGRYRISNHGRVYSLLSNLVLSPAGYPYLKVSLTGETGRKTKYVHRLVAESFISNPNNLPEVDHRDRDTKNNRSDNLRWADKFMQAANRAKPSDSYSYVGSVLVHKDTGERVEYYQGFAKDYNVKPSDILRVLRGDRKTCKGWSVTY